jgi:hypothetical protein
MVHDKFWHFARMIFKHRKRTNDTAPENQYFQEGIGVLLPQILMNPCSSRQEDYIPAKKEKPKIWNNLTGKLSVVHHEEQQWLDYLQNPYVTQK